MTTKFLQQIDMVKKSLSKISIELPEDILIETAIELGPSIYDIDSKFVNTSDPNELNLVKTEFLIGKLNITDNDLINTLIDETIVIVEPLKNKKYRIIFYSILKVLIKNKLMNTSYVNIEEKNTCWDKIKRFFLIKK